MFNCKFALVLDFNEPKRGRKSVVEDFEEKQKD